MTNKKKKEKGYYRRKNNSKKCKCSKRNSWFNRSDNLKRKSEPDQSNRSSMSL